MNRQNSSNDDFQQSRRISPSESLFGEGEKKVAGRMDSGIVMEKELRETTRKLEEVRVLRYEETNELKKQIESLMKEIGRKENCYEELKVQVKLHEDARDKLRAELIEAHRKAKDGDQAISAIRKELAEQQQRYSDDQIEKTSLLKQYDELRESFTTSEKAKLDLQTRARNLEDELFKNESLREALQHDANELKELNSETEGQRIRLHKELQESQKKVKELTCENMQHKKTLSRIRERTAKDDGTKSELRKEILQLKQNISTLLSEKEQIRSDLSTEQRRSKQAESETNMLESQLRQEIEAISKSEKKLRQRYEETEDCLAREMSEKDEWLLKLKGYDSRNQALQSQLAYTEDEKSDLEMRLSSLNTVLKRCLGMNGSRRCKKMMPVRSSSPMKGGTDEDTESGFSFDDDLDFNPNHVERMLRDFSESLKRSEDEKESLTNDLQSAESKLSELLMEVKSLQKKLEEADKVCQASDRAKARLEQQFERTQETIRLQERDISRKDSEYREMVEKVTSLERELRLKDSELKESRKILDRIGNDSARHAEEKNMLRIQIDKHESKCKKMEKARRKLEDEIRKFESSNDDLVREKLALKDQLDGFIEDNKKFAHRVLELEHRAEELMSALEITRSEKTRAADDVRMLEETIDDNKHALTEQQERLRETKRKLMEKDAFNESLAKTIDHLETQLSNYKRSHHELTDKLEFTKDVHRTNEDKVIQLDEELSRVNRTFRDQSRTVDELLSKVATSQSEKRTLEDRLSRAEQETKTSKTALQAIEKSQARKEADLEKLKKRLHKCEAERASFEKSVLMLTEDKAVLESSFRGVATENEDLKHDILRMNRALDVSERKHDRSISEAVEMKIRELELKEERAKMERVLGEREKETDRRMQNDRIVRLEDEISSLQKKLALEQKDRQRIEDVFMRKDDEIGRLRSSFDRSLNTITGDTKNLKDILDKSLHKLDKHLLTKQGLPADSEVTSTEESCDLSKSFSRNSRGFHSIPTKLDKYRPILEEKATDGLHRKASPTRKTISGQKQSPSRKSKPCSERKRYNVNKYSSPSVISSSPNKVPISKRSDRK